MGMVGSKLQPSTGSRELATVASFLLQEVLGQEANHLEYQLC